MAYKKKEPQQTDNGAGLLTNEDDRKKFKQILVTITHYLQIIDDQREAIKEVVDEAAEQFGVDKKIVRKLAKTMFARNYADVQEENEHFASLYEVLVEGKKVATDPLDDE